MYIFRKKLTLNQGIVLSYNTIKKGIKVWFCYTFKQVDNSLGYKKNTLAVIIIKTSNFYFSIIYHFYNGS